MPRLRSFLLYISILAFSLKSILARLTSAIGSLPLTIFRLKVLQRGGEAASGLLNVDVERHIEALFCVDVLWQILIR